MNRPLCFIIGFFDQSLSRYFATMPNTEGNALLCTKGKFNVHVHHVDGDPNSLVVSVTVDLRDDTMVRGTNGRQTIEGRVPLFERTYDIRDPAFNPIETVDQILKACADETALCHP